MERCDGAERVHWTPLGREGREERRRQREGRQREKEEREREGGRRREERKGGRGGDWHVIK